MMKMEIATQMHCVDDVVAEFKKRQFFAAEIFAKKNADYGTENIKDSGIPGLLTRMQDKLARIRNLSTSGTPGLVKESLTDTCLDLANYALMLSMVADGEWPGAQKATQSASNSSNELLFTDYGPECHLFAPQRPGDVGYDLALSDSASVKPGELAYLATGVSVKCPKGHWLRIVGRSSTMRKHKCFVPEGIIDEEFTGELFIGVLNFGTDTVDFERGARLAQVILIRSAVVPLQHVDILPKTVRGTNGFGSTGEK